jgi:hypoxanthine phosphoribosyltransferase
MIENPATTVRPLFTADEIAARIRGLAVEIAGSEPRDLLAIIVLKGGFVFGADLVRALALEGVRLEIEFISLSSYGSRQKTSGEVRVVRDIECPWPGRDVLIIDDVLDSGLTLKFARDLMASRGARAPPLRR